MHHTFNASLHKLQVQKTEFVLNMCFILNLLLGATRRPLTFNEDGEQSKHLSSGAPTRRRGNCTVAVKPQRSCARRASLSPGVCGKLPDIFPSPARGTSSKGRAELSAGVALKDTFQ